MLNITTLHVIKNPAGTYSYVGQIPADLCYIVPATKSDVMGGRAWIDKVNGDLVTYKTPIFKSRENAVRYATDHGYKVEEN
jgi:hypothetical protein